MKNLELLDQFEPVDQFEPFDQFKLLDQFELLDQSLKITSSQVSLLIAFLAAVTNWSRVFDLSKLSQNVDN